MAQRGPVAPPYLKNIGGGGMYLSIFAMFMMFTVVCVTVTPKKIRQSRDSTEIDLQRLHQLEGYCILRLRER